jgi:hypothetical protein
MREQAAFQSYLNGGEARTYAALETGAVPGSVNITASGRSSAAGV